MQASRDSLFIHDYWDLIADQYQREISISCHDFHFGPLMPGDRELRILPPLTAGMRCLELGCGAGQNSIYLARHGARCLAIDRSANQLRHGEQLARRHQVEIEFRQADLNEWKPSLPEQSLDLIHSSYTLPFLSQPGDLLKRVARLLKPQGWLVFSAAHPLAHAEWLTSGPDETGIFLKDYYSPPADQRNDRQQRCREICRTWPISTMASWLTEAGLPIHHLREPKPVPDPDQTGREPPPYDSADWRKHRAEMACIPAVVIFAGRKN